MDQIQNSRTYKLYGEVQTCLHLGGASKLAPIPPMDMRAVLSRDNRQSLDERSHLPWLDSGAGDDPAEPTPITKTRPEVCAD